jgi:hypothetical protein
VSPFSPFSLFSPGGPACPGSPFSPISPFSPLTSLTPSEQPTKASAAANIIVTETLRIWPAPGSEDTELGVLMELEVGHGETEVHAGVQA